MIGKIKALFGMGPGPDYAQWVKEGAMILDVRSEREFSQGHIKGSVNMSVDALPKNLKALEDKNVRIITCCASGMRSAMAKRILESNGFTRVHNGGSWVRLQKEIK